MDEAFPYGVLAALVVLFGLATGSTGSLRAQGSPNGTPGNHDQQPTPGWQQTTVRGLHAETPPTGQDRACGPQSDLGHARCFSRVGAHILQRPNQATGSSGPYTPQQIQAAYGFNCGSSSSCGTGKTIAIVDAYDDPNAASDLTTFDNNWSPPLPAPANFLVYYAQGTIAPAEDSTGGWEIEESLDIEWAHAMAPQATILLVEAANNSYADLLQAVTDAAQYANVVVVSMSWGGGEFSSETGSSYDGAYLISGSICAGRFARGVIEQGF